MGDQSNFSAAIGEGTPGDDSGSDVGDSLTTQLVQTLRLLVPKNPRDWRTKTIHHFTSFHSHGLRLSGLEKIALDSIAHYYRTRPMMLDQHVCTDRCKKYKSRTRRRKVKDIPML